ncbi:protein YgfX [Vibrio artabrorum]|uniref:protein YgfX n=1 Tax=Vibrio artabrorum TaxID=446374 RepID=UPI0029056850|nr:protein YgfX [Vibrio artabrorum]
MLQWLIKLLHITSARFVKLQLTPSYSALCTKGTLFGCLLFSIVLSSIPLAASLYCLALLINLFQTNHAILNSAHGCFDYKEDGEIRLNNRTYRLKSVDKIWAQFFVKLQFECGHSVLLWRDSCCEGEYRHFLAHLQRER